MNNPDVTDKLSAPNTSAPRSGSVALSSDERTQSLRREGWKTTWMGTALRSGDEIAVVFPNGEYFRGKLCEPLNDKLTDGADKNV